ncbi:MAG: GAF domain-containing protein [Deltaproteobacteria bacterium]|nr:GAF domain-containing protein [Deltaproteobacteria bacterium]
MVTVESHVTDAQTILRLLAYGVVTVSSDWRVTYANPEGERIIGAQGATLWERCPDLEHTAFASGFRYAMSDRTELLSESALPSVGWCQARARPTPDGGLLIAIRQVHAHTIETGQAKQALVIGEIGDALTREDSLRAALTRCAGAIVRQLDVALARIYTVDHEKQMLSLCGTAGIAAADLDQIAIGQHKIGQIAESGDPYLTNDVDTDPHVGRSAWVKQEQIVAFAGYPLRVEDRIVGVMALYTRRLIDHDMLNALSSISDSLALGIDRKTSDAARREAEESVRKQASDLEVLHVLGQELASELDIEMLAQRVVDAATKLARAQLGVFFYNTPSEFMLYAVSGVPRSAFASFAVPRSTSLLGPTFIDRKTVRVDDLTNDARYGSTGPHFGMPVGHPQMTSYIGVPVVGREGRRIGALLFGHERPAVFTEGTQRLLEGVAGHAAIGMDNARMFREAIDMIAALEKSNKELDQFAYVASHDLKAPLRGIANLAQWIEDDLEGKLDDQTKEHLHLLRGRVTRLENLIAGILAYSRAGRDRGAAMRVDVDALVRECWELLAAPETATIMINPGLPTVFASRPQLQQVFMNLIGNAVKYNPGRAIAVEVGVASHKAGFYEFFVRDNGVGIAPEFHEKIWGLFQTLERRDKIESTGIGLSIVRKIVESQGGTTRVESRLGEGAAFIFTWPAEQAEARK